MTTKRIALLGFLAGLTAFGAKPAKTPAPAHRSHHAHVHGTVHMNIALETDKTGTVEVISPGESIVGFEHAATSGADIATQLKALTDISNLAAYVVFDAKSACELQKTNIELAPEKHEPGEVDDDHDKDGAHHGQHTELHAEYALKCKNSVAGTEVNVDFSKRFPRIHDIDVQTVTQAKQGDFDLKNGKGKVKL